MVIVDVSRLQEFLHGSKSNYMIISYARPCCKLAWAVTLMCHFQWLEEDNKSFCHFSLHISII